MTIKSTGNVLHGWGIGQQIVQCILLWKIKKDGKLRIRSTIQGCDLCKINTFNIGLYFRVVQSTVTLVLITVCPKKYAHGSVVLCFVVVMQSFIMNSHEVFIHIQQGCFAGTGAIVRLSQCQWSKPDGYGEISQCITTTKHSKAKTVCIFVGICCMYVWKISLCDENGLSVETEHISMFLQKNQLIRDNKKHFNLVICDNSSK